MNAVSTQSVDPESLSIQNSAIGMGTYIVRCADGTLYTGATKDIVRRIAEHNGDGLGAKYTKMRRPVELAYFEPAETWSDACKREAAIKKLSRTKKLLLVF